MDDDLLLYMKYDYDIAATIVESMRTKPRFVGFVIVPMRRPPLLMLMLNIARELGATTNRTEIISIEIDGTTRTCHFYSAHEMTGLRGIGGHINLIIIDDFDYLSLSFFACSIVPLYACTTTRIVGLYIRPPTDYRRLLNWKLMSNELKPKP